MKFEFAKHYDQYAIAQKQVAQKLASALHPIQKQFSSAFEIGCGSGIFTSYLKNEFGCNQLTVNDLYEAKPMAEFPHLIGDISILPLPQNLDLIASSSTLQWISDLDALLKKIKNALHPGTGLFAASTFTAGTLFELESYTHQGLQYLTDAEFQDAVSRYLNILHFSFHSCTVTFDSLHELLKSLKETGVNNIDGNFHLTRNSLNGLKMHFAENYRLTYRYSIVVAKAY